MSVFYHSRWALLMMAMYPGIQRRVQAEIGSVVPEGRLPSLQDRSKLVYTEAVMCEVFRWATIVPFAVPHAVSETFNYQGFTFPAKSMLLYNIWSAHRNPRVWIEPDRFNPGRFLDSAGKIDKSLTEHLIPFGVGKCLKYGFSIIIVFYAKMAVMAACVS